MTRLAFCPHPPLLPAGTLVGDVEEAGSLRDASLDAVRDLVAGAPSVVVVLGPDGDDLPADETAGGSLEPHGIALAAGAGGGATLGLAHTVGAWLLDGVGWDGPRRYAATLDTADLEADVAVLVMADGSATRTEKAPGHLDARANAFDAAIASALADGDPDALGGIDLALAADLWCHGAATLRVAGDAVAARVHRDDARVTARLSLDQAPFGVGWFVASWQLG